MEAHNEGLQYGSLSYCHENYKKMVGRSSELRCQLKQRGHIGGAADSESAQSRIESI